MKASEHEGAIVTGVVGLLLVGWLGFLVHRSPRRTGRVRGRHLLHQHSHGLVSGRVRSRAEARF